MDYSIIGKATKRLPIIHHISSKQMVFMILVFFLISFLLPDITRSQKDWDIRQDLFSSSFPTKQQGWVCGRWGAVLHTEDGGQNWVLQNTGTDYSLTSICFTDPKNGWAVGDRGTIIHTKDGGNSWTKQKCPVDLFLMGVYFVDDKTGWVVTEFTTILYTKDGGKDWQVQFRADDFILRSVSFCDPLNGWAAGEYGYIYHTTDGGSTWEHQAGYFGFSETEFDLIGENSLFDVVAIDPLRAWVVGIDGYIARTEDGGATWEKVKSDNIPKAPIFSISSDKQGDTLIIAGKGFLLASMNGGNQFNTPKIKPPVTYGWLYGVAPRDSNGFIAVGKEGWIYLSDEKGTAWQRAGISSGG